MADLELHGTATPGEPEQPFTDANTAFMTILRTPALQGLRAELRIDGQLPLIGRYAGAGMRRHPQDASVSLIEPTLVFRYADADADQVAEEQGKDTREGESTQLADKFQPGHTYTDTEFGWRFRCDTITSHPENGEVVALGWRFWHGWESYAYGEDDRLVWQDEGTGGGALT